MQEEKKDGYRCRSCGWTGSGDRDHCPNCLCAEHAEDDEGYECGGTLQPVSIWVKPDDSWEIIGRCTVCGGLCSAHVVEDDNPVKLLSIAFGPLGAPPFPIEKMKEMTDMMGGQGDMGGYFDEQGK